MLCISPPTLEGVAVLRAAASAQRPTQVPFHALRHTAATLRLENSEHPKMVQEMLDHTNISQTLGTYPHVNPNMQSEAAERLDSMLF